MSAGPGKATSGKMKTCRSCGVEIIFAKHHRSGRTMIFDASPVLGDDGGAWLLVAGVATHVPVEERGELPLFRDHHASCTHAKQWKGRNRSNPPPQMELGS